MISVAAYFPCRAIRLSRSEVERCVTYVCRNEKRNKASVTVVFTDDRTIRGINKKHLGHDCTTDVISFTFEDAPLEGEVYINLEQARRQAKEFSVTPLNEATRLLVHGVLHCCGYDDAVEPEKKAMTGIQERYVTALRKK
jgi:probable rRNA maturation factor